MKEVEIGPCQCCAVNVGKKKSFVEKSISGVLNFFQESLISEGFAKRDGLLQSLDPRVKLISAIVLVVAVSLTRDIRVLFVVLYVDLAVRLPQQDRSIILYQARMGIRSYFCGHHRPADSL